MRFRKLGAGLGLAGLLSIGLVGGVTQQASAGPGDISPLTTVADIDFGAANAKFLSPGNGSPAADTSGPANVDAMFYDASSYKNNAVFEAMDGYGVKFKSSPSSVQYQNTYNTNSAMFLQDAGELVIDRQPFVATIVANLGTYNNFADSTNLFQRGRYGVGTDLNGGQVKLQLDEANPGTDGIQGTSDDWSMPQCHFEATNDTDTDSPKTYIDTLTPSLPSDADFTFNATDGAFHTYKCWYDGTYVGLSIDGVVYDQDAWSFGGPNRSFDTTSDWPWRIGTQLGYNAATNQGPYGNDDTCKNCKFDSFKLQVSNPSAAFANPGLSSNIGSQFQNTSYAMAPTSAGKIASTSNVSGDLYAYDDWSQPTGGTTKFGVTAPNNPFSGAAISNTDTAGFWDPGSKGFAAEANFKSYEFSPSYSADQQVLLQKGSYVPSGSGQTGYWRMTLVPGTGQVNCKFLGGADPGPAPYTDNLINMTSQQRVTDGEFHTARCWRYHASNGDWKYGVEVDGKAFYTTKNIGGNINNNLDGILSNKAANAYHNYDAVNQARAVFDWVSLMKEP